MATTLIKKLATKTWSWQQRMFFSLWCLIIFSTSHSFQLTISTVMAAV